MNRASAWLDWRRRALILQLVATVMILGWLPGNALKLGAMAVVWAVGFGRLTTAEVVTGALVNLLFIGMDEAALRQGSFRFSHPDVYGLPIFELFMWSFYTLNTVRFFADAGARPRRIVIAVGLAVVFSLPFSLISDPAYLALAAGAVLAIGFVLFHDPLDAAFASYMAVMGAIVEYVGVWTGQWSYPHAPFGPVPLWSFVMWAGIGLLTRRLLLPLYCLGAASLRRKTVIAP